MIIPECSIVRNAKLYGLNESIRASKFPMAADINELNYSCTERTRSLAKAPIGSGHDNFLNGIIVQFDLTFTVKAWTQSERYNFFKFVSSQSTMHRITRFDLDEAYVPFVNKRIVEIMMELVSEYNKNPTDEGYLEILYSNSYFQREEAQMQEETLNTIINAAAHLEELRGIVADLSDFHLHTCLKQLYQDHKDGKITTEDAAAMKEQLIRAWKSDKDTLAAYRQMHCDFNEKIRIAEQTGKQLHKADSLRKFAEDAAVILEAVIGEVGLVKLVGELE